MTTAVNLSTLVAEALRTASPPLNVSAIVAEVLRQAGPAFNSSAIVAEVLRQANPSVRVSTIVAEVLYKLAPFPYRRRLAQQVAMEGELREERHFWTKQRPSPAVSRIDPYFFNYVNILPQVAPLILTRHATPGLP